VAWRGVLALGVGLLAGLPSAGADAETAGVLTEIRSGRGRVEIRRGPGGEWRRAAPLMGLRGGDVLRASEGAAAVVVLSGGRGSVTIDEARSPYTVPAPPAERSTLRKGQELIEASLRFLAGAPEEPRAVLTTRALRPPLVISPRNTATLGERLIFEWVGPAAGRYMVQVLAPDGRALVHQEVTGPRFEYPPGAPPPAPGPRHVFRVTAGEQVQEAWFSVLEAPAAAAIRAELADLDEALGAQASAGTRATLRAALLARAGLAHDARRTLLEAIAADPSEPALRLLLSRLYAASGLAQLARATRAEAEALAAGAAAPAR
jgi:hypothetical protein